MLTNKKFMFCYSIMIVCVSLWLGCFLYYSVINNVYIGIFISACLNLFLILAYTDSVEISTKKMFAAEIIDEIKRKCPEEFYETKVASEAEEISVNKSEKK